MDTNYITLVKTHTHGGTKYPPGKILAVGPEGDVQPGTASWMFRQGVAVWGKDSVPHAMIDNAIAAKLDPTDRPTAPTLEAIDLTVDHPVIITDPLEIFE